MMNVSLLFFWRWRAISVYMIRLLVLASSPHTSDQVRQEIKKKFNIETNEYEIHMNHQSKKKNKLLETHKLRTNMEWHKKVKRKNYKYKNSVSLWGEMCLRTNVEFALSNEN